MPLMATKETTMKRLMTIGAVLVCGALLMTTDALAGGKRHGGAGGGGGGGGGGFGGRIMSELDLSKEQQTKIENLRIEMEKRTTQVRIELRQKRGELRQLWQAEHPDERTILAKQAEMDPLRQQLRAEGIKFRVAAFEVLTPDQKTKLREIMEQPMRHMRGGHKGGGRMGGMGGMGFGFGGCDGPGCDSGDDAING